MKLYIRIFITASLFSFSLSFSFFAFVHSWSACVLAQLSNFEFLYLVRLPRITRGFYECVLRIFHMHSEIKRGRCETCRRELNARARTYGQKYCDRIASCHANRPDFINAPAPWHGTLLSRPFFFTGHEVRAWSSKIRMRYVSHVLIYRSITTLVECSIRILRLIATGEAKLMYRRFIAVVLFFGRVARFTLLSYRVYFARVRMTGLECLLFEEYTFYSSKLSDRFSNLYCLKIHIFYFHTAIIIWLW